MFDLKEGAENDEREEGAGIVGKIRGSRMNRSVRIS